MKKTFLTLAAIAGLAVVSFAQVAGPTGGAPTTGSVTGARHGGGGGGLKKMNEAIAKLNLSADQTSQLKALETKMAADHKALGAKVKAGTLTKDQAKTEMQTMHKSFMQSILKVLTPDQKKQLMATLKAERKDHKAGPKPTTPPTL